MGFFDFLKPKTNILPFEHFEGLPFVNKGEIIALHYLDTSLSVQLNKKEVLNIHYQNIKDAQVMIEIEQKDKSVIGSALVGGILLGGVGATIGAIAGTGKTKKNNYFLKIIYQENEELKELYFKGAFNSENICNIAKKQIVEKVQS